MCKVQPVHFSAKLYFSPSCLMGVLVNSSMHDLIYPPCVADSALVSHCELHCLPSSCICSSGDDGTVKCKTAAVLCCSTDTATYVSLHVYQITAVAAELVWPMVRGLWAWCSITEGHIKGSKETSLPLVLERGKKKWTYVERQKVSLCLRTAYRIRTVAYTCRSALPFPHVQVT